MATTFAAGADDTPVGDVQDFEGPYAESRWNFEGGSGNGVVEKTNLPRSLKIIGSNNSIADNTDYTTTVAKDGHIMFDWEFVSEDTPGFAYDGFGYLLNDEFTELATSESNNVVLLDVKAGDRFGFRIFTIDAQGGSGMAVVSNFSSMVDIMPSTPNYEPGLVTIGGVNVGKTDQGIALKKGDGAPAQVKLNGDNVTEKTIAGWNLLAASDDSGGGFDLFFKSSSSDKYAKWTLDDKGRYVKGDLLTLAQLLEEEKHINYDINKDGAAGEIYEDKGSNGGISYGKTQLGLALKKGDGALAQVKLNGDNVTEKTIAGWDLLAASDDGAAGFGLFFKSSSSDKYAKWTLDDKGRYVKGDLLTLAQLLEEEKHINYDINKDGAAGEIYEDKGSNGGISYGKTQLGLALKKGDGALAQVKLNGDNVTEKTIAGWDLLAASDDGAAGFGLFFKSSSSDKYAKWTLDDKGRYVKGDLLTLAQLMKIEESTGHDINGDGMMGDNMKMILSSTSHTLEPGLEHLVLTGAANVNGTGNDLDNIIEGNSGGNILDGKGGVDLLTGHEGADTFVFSTAQSYGISVADHIIDFNPAEGDRLEISKDAFGISKASFSTFLTVGSDSELNAALRTGSLFVYSSSNGSLYFNKNNTEAGFGDGGIFAVLDNAAQLNASSISLF